VINDPTIAVRHHTIEHPEQIRRADDQTRFFQRLALSALPQRFAQFKHPPGNRPLTQQWRFAPLNKHGSAIFDNQRADADQRLLWMLSLHLVLFSLSAI
jgi:hypothetical protein